LPFRLMRAVHSDAPQAPPGYPSPMMNVGASRRLSGASPLGIASAAGCPNLPLLSACSRYPRFEKPRRAAIAPRTLDLWLAAHRQRPFPELPCFLVRPCRRSTSNLVSSSPLSFGEETRRPVAAVSPLYSVKRKREDNWLTWFPIHGRAALWADRND
jgi:hypothetical protein